jgi:hypothetical protein
MIISTIAPTLFPIYAFPEKARNAALELQRNTGAPLPLIACSVLTPMSIAIQGLANVKRLNGLEGPVSMWFLIIGESGERKTAVDAKTLKPLHDFDALQSERYKYQMVDFESKMLGWQVEQQVILKTIKKKFANRQSTDESKAWLADHSLKIPIKPRLTTFLVEDITAPALVQNAFGQFASKGLVSSEGNSILAGHAIRNLSVLNSVWSGAPLLVDRIGQKNVAVLNPRITISIMTQAGPLHRFCDRKGQEARDTGFFARFNIANPPSTQGQRYIFSAETDWCHLPIFQERIKELAELHIGPDGCSPEKHLLCFAPNAQARWIEVYNEIEARVNPGRDFFNVKDYAAKIADNIARLAAQFHFFDGREGTISLQTLENAITVAVWFADEFLRLFSPHAQAPQEQIDAVHLEIWLAHYFHRAGGLINIKRNFVYQCITPRALRNKERFNNAFDILFAANKIGFFVQGKTRWICPNANYFTPSQVQWLCSQRTAIG